MKKSEIFSKKQNWLRIMMSNGISAKYARRSYIIQKFALVNVLHSSATPAFRLGSSWKTSVHYAEQITCSWEISTLLKEICFIKKLSSKDVQKRTVNILTLRNLLMKNWLNIYRLNVYKWMSSALKTVCLRLRFANKI